MKKSFQYSRTFPLQVQMSWNQAHAPLLIESFRKTPRRTWSEASWFRGSHNYKTKQNKLPSFIDRWCSKKKNLKTQIWKVPCLFHEYGVPIKSFKKTQQIWKVSCLFQEYGVPKQNFWKNTNMKSFMPLYLGMG